MNDKQSFQQKVKVLSRLYEFGCRSEKELLSFTLENILEIPNITVSEIRIISALQKNIKANRVFSYLGGDGENSNE